MWKIKQIEEADYGCEERMPGEPLMVLVTIENEWGRAISFETADSWLIQQELEEGDEWPEDIDAIEEKQMESGEMSKWMDNYYQALEEYEEESGD